MPFFCLFNIPSKIFSINNHPLVVFKCKYERFKITNNENKNRLLKKWEHIVLILFLCKKLGLVKEKKILQLVFQISLLFSGLYFCSIFISCSKWREIVLFSVIVIITAFICFSFSSFICFCFFFVLLCFQLITSSI